MKLDDWLGIRRRNAELYNQCLRDVAGLRTTIPGPGIGHAYYKYYVFLRPERLRDNWSRARVLGEVRASGARCMTGSCPEVYLESAIESAHRPAQP